MAALDRPILSLASGLLFLAALAPTSGQESTPIRIGVLTDMRGALSDTSGRGSVAAVQIAVDEYGGKILQRPIEVLSADHQNKPDIGTAIARKWFDVDNVDVVTDLQNSSVAIAVQDLAKTKGKLSIVTAVGASDLTGPNCEGGCPLAR